MGGLFITLEGIEGSGKSTQLEFLKDRFSRHGLPCTFTKEPGGTVLGRGIRTILLEPHPSGERWCPQAELLLFCADRAQHIETTIKPALKAGRIVVSDRFEDSTRAYQGAQGIDGDSLAALRQIILKGLRPDLTLLLDACPEEALSRANSRNSAEAAFSETRFDHETLDFHKRVRDEFLRIASLEPSRFCLIKADEDKECVAGSIWAAVAPKLAAAGFVLR